MSPVCHMLAVCYVVTVRVGQSAFVVTPFGCKNVDTSWQPSDCYSTNIPAQALGSLLVLWRDTLSKQITLWSDNYVIWPDYVQFPNVIISSDSWLNTVHTDGEQYTDTIAIRQAVQVIKQQHIFKTEQSLATLLHTSVCWGWRSEDANSDEADENLVKEWDLGSRGEWNPLYLLNFGINETFLSHVLLQHKMVHEFWHLLSHWKISNVCVNIITVQ